MGRGKSFRGDAKEMTETRRFRRADPPPPRAESRADRLDELLRDWGRFVREYRPADQVSGIKEPAAFSASRALYVEFVDMLDAADKERMRMVDACVNDLMAEFLTCWLIIHWHYAHRTSTAPAVWRHRRLPAHDTPEYESLLELARDKVRAALVRRRQTHLLDC